MKNNYTLAHRLKTYSSMASLILGAGALTGQLVVTDIEPDIVFDSNGDLYLLDIDNDVSPEFILYMATNSYPAVFMGAAGFVTGASINASSESSGAYFYPIINLNGEMISSADNWYGYVGGLMTMASVDFYFSGSWANWYDVTDGYLALRFEKDGNTHYGWARLDASPDGFQFTLKDYAYNATADQGICIGDNVGPADDCLNAIEASSWVGVLDIADNGNGLDLGFSFNQSPTETAISEYRVIAVKSAAAASFTLGLAETMSGDQVVAIAPYGLPTYEGTLVANSTDSDGDPITFGVAYKLFVYSVSDDYPAVLSGGSIDITLSEPVAISNLSTDVLHIYPNPAMDFILVDCDQNSDISIYNSTGDLIRTINNIEPDFLISIQDLSSGNYFVVIKNGDSVAVKSFIKS